MSGIPLEYWNKLASQFIFIVALLGGFSLSLIITLLTHNLENKFTKYIFIAAIFTAASFIVSLFAMTGLVMMTTPGYPQINAETLANEFSKCRNIGAISLLFGTVSLLIIIALSGWAKSKRLGIFSTIISLLAFILIAVAMS